MAWVSPSKNIYHRTGCIISPRNNNKPLRMAIDYNDPVVAEEFAKVQPMEFEEVEAELKEKGIPVPPTMNDMELKLMLVEMRLSFAGKLGDEKKEKKKPDKFSSKFEEAMWTKPMFEEFYNEIKKDGDANAINAKIFRFKGKVTFEEIDDAKKAVDQYNGMDM